MDFDLVSNIMDGREDVQHNLTGYLLPNLPNRPLTAQLEVASAMEIPRVSSPAIGQTYKSIRSTPGAVISRIEDIFEAITDCLLEEGKELVIPLKSRPTNQKNKPGNAEVTEQRARLETKSITFPNKSPQEARRFTILIRILELSHEALVTGIVTTKRDLYYRDPELFVKQAVVDRYVDDISYTFGIERDALNVVAAAKGLVAGSFTITRKDNTSVHYSTEIEGVLVPNSKDVSKVEFQDVTWILVIEKEATFRSLATSKYWQDSLAGKGIIITAKGYPDIQTRQFLHLLSVSHPSIPIFALVDFDPDGLGIMSTYKHGSVALAHESNLAVPSVQWLGVRSSDFLDKNGDGNKNGNVNGYGGNDDPAGILKLTPRDRRIAGKMLEKSMFEEQAEGEWRREVQVMLFLNLKAEIQILGNGERLGGWLDGKLRDGVGMNVM